MLGGSGTTAASPASRTSPLRAATDARPRQPGTPAVAGRLAVMSLDDSFMNPIAEGGPNTNDRTPRRVLIRCPLDEDEGAGFRPLTRARLARAAAALEVGWRQASTSACASSLLSTD